MKKKKTPKKMKEEIGTYEMLEDVIKKSTSKHKKEIEDWFYSPCNPLTEDDEEDEEEQ